MFSLRNMFSRRTKRRILVSLACLVRRYSCYATERLVMSFRLAFPQLCLSLEERKKKKREKRKGKEKNALHGKEREPRVLSMFYPLVRGNATFRNGGKRFYFKLDRFFVVYSCAALAFRELLRSWLTAIIKPRFAYSSSVIFSRTIITIWSF